MTKEEAIALGVSEERLKEFQEKYHKDLRNAVQRHESGSVKDIRVAICGMLPVIHDADALREVLMLVTEVYCRPKPEAKA